jgi:3,4-dihydroxy 2-butanone 4-phosphate synthase/GTP cyclohydrolase II
MRDLVGIRAPTLGWTLRDALQRVAEDGCGVVVILRGHDTPRDLIDVVEQLGGETGIRLRDGQDSVVLRTYGIGAQILRNLGVRKMRVLSAPRQMAGISGFGLEIVEYVE